MITLDRLSAAMMNAAADAIIVINDQGLIRHFSPAASRLFGYAADEVIGRNVTVLMPARYAKDHDQHLARYQVVRQPHIIGKGRDVEGQRKDGSRFPMRLSVGEAQIDGKSFFVGICHDLTAHRDALQQLAMAEQRYREIIQYQSELVCRLDQDLRVTFANLSFSQVLGVAGDDLVGLAIDELVAGDGESFRQLLISLFQSHSEIEQITLKISMKGAEQPVLVDWTFRRLPHSDKYGLELQGFGIDVSERDAAIDRAQFLLNHDQLTGFLNQKGLNDYLKTLVNSSGRYALICIDCENFNLINHRFGFAVGDSLIRQAAARIQSVTDERIVVCRPGGDDFLLLVPIDSEQHTESLVNQLQAVLANAYELGDQTKVNLQILMGVALYPQDTRSPERLPELAEAALLNSRQQHRPCSYFDESYHAELRRKLDIEQGLRNAVTDDRLSIFLQPKYDLGTERVAGYEALLRWQDPVLGTVSPAEFIPVAEQTVLGQQLDRYVIQKVMELINIHLPLRQHRSAGCLHIAINITASHFNDPQLTAFIEENLQRYRVDPRTLCLEVTEGVLMSDSDHVADNLSRLRALGIEVAIDDFGTGYSSLSYLKNLPADELKIDKSFIDDLETPAGATLIKAILDVARVFHLRVVAEGIETENQLVLLQELGCDYGQGYLLGKPAPADEVLKQFEMTDVCSQGWGIYEK